jgi:O-antigen ligase
MIPIHIKLASLTTGILLLVSLLKVENYKEFVLLFKNYRFYILVSPVIIALIGLIYTDYWPEGKSQVEIVISLLLFPFVFVSFKGNKIKSKIELLLSFFVISTLFAYFICTAIALPTFIRNHDFDVFFYSRFSNIIKGPHHLSYSVMFSIILLAFSIAGKLNLFIRKNKKVSSLKIISLVILVVFLFQLTSKITILFLVLFAIIFLIYLIKQKIFPIKKLLIVTSIFALIFISLFATHKVRARFGNMFEVVFDASNKNSKSHESNNLRFAAIDAGLHLIKDNFWMGVGTGDLSTEMSKYYQENDIQGAYIQHISPHNQFIRTFAMYGVFGFISLLAIFAIMLFIAVKSKNVLFFFWTIFMISLFAVEDMFMIQDGIIYFAFYTSFFLFYSDSIDGENNFEEIYE